MRSKPTSLARPRLLAVLVAAVAGCIAAAALAAAAGAASAPPAAPTTPVVRPELPYASGFQLGLDSDGPLVTSPTTAPWSARLTMVDAQGNGYLCSGSIISATQVLTAGHCTHDDVENDAYAASDYTVTVGTDNTGATATMETDTVASVRVMPDYVYSPAGSANDPFDLAELTLTTPLTLNAEVQPIPVVGQGLEPPVGANVAIFGWGEWAVGQSDGLERTYQSTLIQPWTCASGQPATLCSVSPTTDACPGDSGSGLIVAGAAPVLVGVTDFTTYKNGTGATCGAGDATGYVDLASPQYQQFLSGTNITLGRQTTGQATIDDNDDPQVGATVSCSSPVWNSAPAPTVSYLFTDTSDNILQSGPSTYVIPLAELGQSISCVAVATNPGGTAYASADEQTGAIQAQSVPGLAFRLTGRGPQRGAYSAAVDAGGQPLTLTVTAALRDGGAVKFRRTYAHVRSRAAGKLDLRRLPPGAYLVCVTSTPVGIYASARKCARLVQNGVASRYLRLATGRRRGHTVLILRAQSPIRRPLLTVTWTGERHGVMLSVARRLRLRRPRAVLDPPSAQSGLRWTSASVLVHRRRWRGALLRAGSRHVSLTS